MTCGIFTIGRAEVGARIQGTGCYRGERRVSTLVEGHVLAGAIRGVVRGMAVVRGEGMPEGFDRSREAERCSCQSRPRPFGNMRVSILPRHIR